MKTGIHPDHKLTVVTCTCGNKFNILSKDETLSVDICSACHPFYTGQQKIVDTEGRVDRFMKRYRQDKKEAKTG